MLQDTVKHPLKLMILFLSIVLKNIILKHWKSTHALWFLLWKKRVI